MKHAYSEVRDICAIVPVLDEERLIERCLSSITSQEEISQVIVVDGGSSDRTLERVARHGVTVLEGQRGRGQLTCFFPMSIGRV